MMSTPVAAAEAVRSLFGDSGAQYSPPSSGAPAAPAIATPAATQVQDLAAQIQAMMSAMQALADQVNRLTANTATAVDAAPPSAQPVAAAAAAAASAADPLQEPQNDQWMRYVPTHGAAAQMSMGLAGTWAGQGAAPLRPIHPKDVDKPEM